MSAKPANYDAVIIGSGPNGLAAAITLARAGRSVVVIEAAETIGGGARSAQMTLPGFIHDICSAIYPFGVGSPFFRALPLRRHGLTWIYPPAPLAHPFTDGTAAVLERSISATGTTLEADACAYQRFMVPLTRKWDIIADAVLGPFRFPSSPLSLLRFGYWALHSTSNLAKRVFSGERARALFAGLAGHSILPLEQPPSAAFGLVLGIAGHAVGWPIPSGGAQSLSNALADYLRSLGGVIITGKRVTHLNDIPPARAVLCDLSPRGVLSIAGDRLPSHYRYALERYRYGPGVFKIDLALDRPIPWQSEACLRAGTIHIGGTMEEIIAAENAVQQGLHPERPFVLLAQQSLFDPTRAPGGKHTVWAYCHVPSGSTFDMTERIEAQIERFAPGFRTRILARHTMNPQDFERYNLNYIGGDINGGVQDFRQLFTRPTIRINPYTTPVRGLYICSSSTPPGGGVHGMCGYFAAQAALRDLQYQ